MLAGIVRGPVDVKGDDGVMIRGDATGGVDEGAANCVANEGVAVRFEVKMVEGPVYLLPPLAPLMTPPCIDIG